jgi:hypothetical protein
MPSDAAPDEERDGTAGDEPEDSVAAQQPPATPGDPPADAAGDTSGGAPESRWSRRQFVLAGLGVLVSGAAGATTFYFTERADSRAERAEQREVEEHTREYPPSVGDGVRVLKAVAGEYTPGQSLAFVSPEPLDPADFPFGAPTADVYGGLFARGGCWYRRMSLDITIEARRRKVVLDSARVTVRSLGPPPAGGIFVPAPFGGGEVPETDIVHTGINLDAPRPTLRMLDPLMHNAGTLAEQARVRNDPIILLGPFPDKEIVLGPDDVWRLRVLAEARAGCYEWTIELVIFADGEAQTIPIRETNHPLRVSAAAPDYRVALHEIGYGGQDTLGQVDVVTLPELRGWI